MRKLTVLLFLIFGIVAVSKAQSAAISGSVKDTSENRKLQHSVISIIRKSDSVLVAFRRSDDQGNFSIKSIKPDQYILLISYPKYADYVDQVNLKENDDLKIGEIILTPKSQLLEEVIIRQRIAAVRMKGDTLEYRADSFAVREGASVEELLKKLPGIQVNKNGEITAQGEKVQKVLVDGEEFFSDDPAVVTQNLRADAVENVQVFDKKSDQATFTGIDDGEKTKTINLKLKEDKKKGFFGKAKLGGGTPDWFENEAMINVFKGKRKFAAFGTMANTGKAGLNWQDNDKFGGSSNLQYNEEEGYFYSFNESDEFNTWGGRYNGEGLPTAWTGGMHFSNKWNSDKNHINGNYRYNKLNIDVAGNTLSQYILADTQYYNREQRFTFNQNERHQLNGYYEIQVDSSSSIKLTVSGSKTDGQSAASYLGASLDEDSNLVNTNNRVLSSIGEKKNFTANLIWRKKLKKIGRTFSLSVDQAYNDNATDGMLRSDLNFYDPLTGAPDSSIVFDQKKLNNSDALTVNSRVAYTEPLSKTSFLELNYSYRLSNSEAERNTYNKSPEGKYDQLDSIFSNDYQFRFHTHSTGLTYRINKKKFSMSLGSNISFADFTQTDLVTDTTYRYSYTNLFPRATFRFNFGPQRRLNLNYNGNTRQPSLEQIQPIVDNTNTTNIQVGNPNLKQEFRHNLNFNFSDFKVLTSRNIWISANFAYTDNAISTSTLVDKGVRVTQYVNVSGNNTFNMWLGYWFQFKKPKINIGVNGGGSISRFNNYVDNLKNVNTNRSLNVELNVYHDKENKYSFYLNPGFAMNYSRSSINPSAITKYWTSDNEIGTTVQLPWKFEINSEARLNFRQKTEVFTRDVNSIRWNAYLAKKFWKNSTGELRFSVFDILDQNLGFQRNATSNFISENTYNTIRRYWLVSFTWNFSQNAATGNGGGN